MPALIAVVLGMILGLACGGSLSRLVMLKLRMEWVILPLFAIQAVARGRLPGVDGASQWALPLWLLASSVLAWALVLNYRTPGMLLGAVGVLGNLLVVVLNGAMPVVLPGSFARLATGAGAAIGSESGGFYRVALQGDLLPWMGDVIPLVLGGGMLLVSLGDIVLMVAVAVIIVHGMTLESSTSSLQRCGV